jgi:hypothetical protein
MFQVDNAARAVPLQRLHELLAAAVVHDLQPVGSARPRARRGRRTSRAHEVLHRHRLAGAQQRAVEHAVRAQSGCGPLAVGWLKRQGSMPCCQLPKTKAMSATPLASVLGGDEQPVVGRAAFELRIEGLRARARPLASVRPFHSGSPRQSWMTTSAPATGLATVQRGHPHHGILAPMLEVHAEVGDQHARAHVHRRLLVEQGLAQAPRLDLDDVEAGLGQRDADHLEGARVAAGELRQVEPLGLSIAGSSDTSRVATGARRAA